MKKLFWSLIIAIPLLLAFCKKDEELISNLEVASIVASGTSFLNGATVNSDLNGATAVKDVAINAKITITFSKAINPASISATSAKLGEGAVNPKDVPAAVSGSGTSITVTPNAPFQRGTLYTLTLTQLKGADGASFFDVSRTFTTEGRAAGVVPKPESLVGYWRFDDNSKDEQNTFTASNTVAVVYGADRFGQAKSSASFDGDKSIIEIPMGDKLVANKDFTLSFWMKSNSTGHVNEVGDPAGYFLFGLGAFKGFQFEVPADFGSCKLAASYTLANGTFASEDLWFNGDGKSKDNGGWQGWDFAANIQSSGGVAGLLKDKWAHVVCTYNAVDKSGKLFINGELMKSQDFDLWPDAKNTTVGVGWQGAAPELEPILAFGFIKSINSKLWADTPWGDYAKPTANHYKGDLDDIRIYKTFLTAAEVKSLYNAEKP